MQKKRSIAGARVIYLGLVALLVTNGFAVVADEPSTARPEPASATAESAEEASAETPAQEQPVNRRLDGLRLGGGLQAYIDPQTGVLVVPPVKVRRQLSSRTLDLISTSHDGLEVIEMPNGYSYVDLQNRFFSATTATIEEDGEVRIYHGLPALSTSVAADAETAASSEGGQP